MLAVQILHLPCPLLPSLPYNVSLSNASHFSLFIAPLLPHSITPAPPLTWDLYFPLLICPLSLSPYFPFSLLSPGSITPHLPFSLSPPAPVSPPSAPLCPLTCPSFPSRQLASYSQPKACSSVQPPTAPIQRLIFPSRSPSLSPTPRPIPCHTPTPCQATKSTTRSTSPLHTAAATLPLYPSPLRWNTDSYVSLYPILAIFPLHLYNYLISDPRLTPYLARLRTRFLR